MAAPSSAAKEAVTAAVPVLILKEGTERRTGRTAQLANIIAATTVAESVKTSLGPKGMDKMLIDSFGDVTITNDGATILDKMDIQHPAAKMMVEVAKAQDKEVGDGTTTAVILAGELLQKARELLEKNIHPILIADGFQKAKDKALSILDEMAIDVDPMDRNVLKKVAMTAVIGKTIAEYRDFLSDLAVEAALRAVEKRGDKYYIDIDDIKVEKKAGGSLTDTQLIQGVVLDKEVVYADMPRRVEKAKIALLNCPLEIEKTEFDAKITITSPEMMKSFMDQEEEMLREKVEKIANVGANVVICQKGIDDVAQFFLARKGIYAVRRVKASDMEKLAKATGGTIVTNIDDLSEENLGYAELVEERKVGDEKWTFISGCKDPKAVSILIRGGNDKLVEEAERSIHDAICVVKDVIENPKIVAGGGAPEIEVSRRLRQYAETLTGRESLATKAFADALEEIPATLATNAGLDPVDILIGLRAAHERGEKWAGINVFTGKIEDMYKLDVLEPLTVKKQALKSACEAAIMILRIHDVLIAAKVEEKKPPTPPSEEGEGREEV